MIRLSTTEYKWTIFTDEDKTIPFNDLDNYIGLTIIAKKKASDPDDEAIFTIGQNSMTLLNNEVTFTVTDAMTASLSVSKPTTITLELVKLDPPRKTLAQQPIAVYPTYKDAVEA